MEIRGNGSVYELKPGVYTYRFSLGKDPDTGKYRYSKKRTLHCKAKNKRGREAELRRALEDYKRELETGIAPRQSTDLTVAEYAELFHSQRKGTLGSELSWQRESLDIKHIKELLGNVKVAALKPPVIKKAYASVRETGRFSENELHKIHSKLNQIMKEAVNDELIVKNPCASISVPQPQPKERRSLTVEQAARLQQCLNEEYERCKLYEPEYKNMQLLPRLVGTMFLLDTGCRRGEMLAIDWKHIDLPSGIVYLAQQFAKDKTLREPKSQKSKRYVKISDEMLSVLKEWKSLQADYLCMINEEQRDTTPVVSNELGENLDPDYFGRWFRDWCVENSFGKFENEIDHTGYVGLTPHMLRHTQATLLIGANTDIKTVQARLGHASADMTINTYSHAIAKKEAEASETFSNLLKEKENA